MSVDKKILGIIIGLGIFFRCFALDHHVFWHDEIYTQLHIAGYFSHTWKSALFTGKILTIQDLQFYLRLPDHTTLWDTLKVLAKDDPHHPPLYYILARFWLQLWGDSIFILRSFSVVCGLLVLPAIYLLTQELFQSTTVSLMGVALVAISPFQVLYAQEAREYALWTVIIICSNLALLRGLRFVRRRLNWGLYTLSLIFGFYTSIFTGLLVLTQGFYVIVREKFKLTQNVIYYSVSVLISLVVFIPWIGVFIANYEQFKRSTAWTKSIFVSPTELLKNLAINLSRIFVLINDDASLILTHFSMIIGIILVGYALYFVTINQRWNSEFLLSLSLIPLLTLLIPDLLWGGVRSLSPRYLIPSWIGMHLAVAYLLGTQLTKKKFWQIVTIFIFSVGLISCTFNAYNDTAWTKGINYNLPTIARIINKSDRCLVIGNIHNYQPGTLFSLSYLLSPKVKLQLLANEHSYQFPQGFETIYLLNPSEQFIEQFNLELLFKDYHLGLWKQVLSTKQ